MNLEKNKSINIKSSLGLCLGRHETGMHMTVHVCMQFAHALTRATILGTLCSYLGFRTSLGRKNPKLISLIQFSSLKRPDAIGIRTRMLPNCKFWTVNKEDYVTRLCDSNLNIFVSIDNRKSMNCKRDIYDAFVQIKYIYEVLCHSLIKKTGNDHKSLTGKCGSDGKISTFLCTVKMQRNVSNLSKVR